VIRLAAAAALAALAAAVAGCGNHTSPRVERHVTRHRPPAARHVAKAKRPVVRHRAAKLVITVADGDTDARIRGAHVVVWGRRGVADRHGVATVRVPWRRALNVTVRARRYPSTTVWEDFARYRRVTVRVYRPALQWPLYGATPTRTQAQRRIPLRPPFKSVWSVPMGGLIEFPAVVWNGKAYIGNAHATIRAVSVRTGSVVWRHDTPHGQMASSPAVWGGFLVYHGMDGNVWVLDRATGRLRWRFHVGSPIESSPIVRHGVDYFGSWNGRLYALDLRRRRLAWTRSLGAKITASATLAGKTLYIGDYAGRLWALAVRTGRTRWTAGVNGRIYGTAPVASGRLFVPSSNGSSLTAFTTSGRRLWRVQLGTYVYSSPAVWHGRVFFGSYNGVFYCVSAASGRILWERSVGGAVSGAAVVVDGVAYAGSFAGRILGVDARTGRILLRFPHGHYVPVSGNGRMLLFHAYSSLYGMRPRR
jgi:outer membrane protein assembly factor BamB